MPSVSGRVLAAVIQVVQALPLVPAQTVRKRKNLILADGENPPLLLAAQGEGWDHEIAWKGTWFVRYPVSIAIAFPKDGVLADDTSLRDWKDMIWPALLDFRNLAAAGLLEVNRVLPGDRGTFDPAGLSAQVDWAVTDFTVETLEKRY